MSDKQEEKIKKLFGMTLKKLRVYQGQSQENFALHSNIDRTFIGKIERAQRQPSLSTLFKIAVELKIPPSELIKQSIDPLYHELQSLEDETK